MRWPWQRRRVCPPADVEGRKVAEEALKHAKETLEEAKSKQAEITAVTGALRHMTDGDDLFAQMLENSMRRRRRHP